MTYFLDSSALLAHYCDEPGRDHVSLLLDDTRAVIGISALSLYETDRRLVALGADPVTRQSFSTRYTTLVDFVAPVDVAIVHAAIWLRESASERISTVDMLIAATAHVHDAVLVHRDSHFAAIPAAQLRQLVLS